MLFTFVDIHVTYDSSSNWKGISIRWYHFFLLNWSWFTLAFVALISDFLLIYLSTTLGAKSQKVESFAIVMEFAYLFNTAESRDYLEACVKLILVGLSSLHECQFLYSYVRQSSGNLRIFIYIQSRYFNDYSIVEYHTSYFKWRRPLIYHLFICQK